MKSFNISILLIAGLFCSVSAAEMPYPQDLHRYFADDATRNTVRQAFNIPVRLKEFLDKTLRSEDSYALSLQRKYTGQEIRTLYEYDKFENLKKRLKEQGFTITHVGDRLSLVHDDAPEYIIQIQWRTFDERISQTNKDIAYPICNQFQGISSVPGRINAARAIVDAHAENYITIPTEMYYYSISDNEQPTLTDFNYITVSKRVNVMNRDLKEEMLAQLGAEQAEAFKGVIRAGGIWAAENIDFTADGKILINLLVQPDVTRPEAFFNKSVARFLQNIQGGMESFNELMDTYNHPDYKFTDAELTSIFVQRQIAQAIESDLN